MKPDIEELVSAVATRVPPYASLESALAAAENVSRERSLRQEEKAQLVVAVRHLYDDGFHKLAGTSPFARMQRISQTITAHWSFKALVFAVVVLCTILLGVEGAQQGDPVGDDIDYYVAGFFIVEIVLRLLASGRYFFVVTVSDRGGTVFNRQAFWNILDLLVVLSCVAVIIGNVSSVSPELVFILRIPRALRMVQPISARSETWGLLWRIRPVAWFLLPLGAALYSSALGANHLFGEKTTGYFDTTGQAFATMVELLRMEGWNDVAIALSTQYPVWGPLFLAVFAISMVLVIVNIIITIFRTANLLSGQAENRAMIEKLQREIQEHREVVEERVLSALRELSSRPSSSVEENEPTERSSG